MATTVLAAGQGGSGRVYAYEPDGTLETGWPVASVNELESWSQ